MNTKNYDMEIMEKKIYFHKNVFYKEYTNCVILYNVYDFEHKLEMNSIVVKIFRLINGDNKVRVHVKMKSDSKKSKKE